MEALPLGTERIKQRTINKRYVRRERFIKVSHHGKWWHRWRPFARHWWEKHVCPIPEGYTVYHRDGDTLHDDPANYILCRADRFKLIFATRPEARRTQQRRRSKAVAKANRRRARIARSQIKASAWYLVLPRSHAIVWEPCRTQLAARRLSVPGQLTALCLKDRVRIEELKASLYDPSHPVKIVRGDELLRGSQHDGPFEGFVRLIPDVRRAPVKRRPKPVDNLVDLIGTR